MANKRSYEDACGAARALDLIGERWALLVVRELLLGPKRFTDLRSGLPGISPNVLTQRLTELEEDGIIARRKLPPPAGSWVYELTQWGIELGPIVMDLGRWGARSPVLGHHTGLSPDAMAISLRTMFDAAASKKAKAKGRFELKGTAHDIVVPVTIAQNGAQSTATGEFVVKRLDYKIGENEWTDVSLVANDVRVRFKLVFTGLNPL